MEHTTMSEPTLEHVPITEIEVRPQVRRQFDDAEIAELAESIHSVGLQQPLLCRRSGGKLILIDGERRWRACSSLGWTSVPVLVLDERLDPAETLVRQLVANLQRADLAPIDRAEGIHSLMQHGSLTVEQASKRLGLSSAAVTRSLAILKLPEAIREQVAAGNIPADTAYQLSRVADVEEQAMLAKKVADNEMTRDELAKRLRKKPAAKAAPIPRRVTLVVGEGRSLALAGTGWKRELGLDELIECLEQLVARGRKASKQGLSLATFASTLKDQASA
jgi:ParB family chromosome partitioning protein